MKNLIINIRGCNGSGKSTIVMGLIKDPKKFVVYKHIEGRKSKFGILTVFPSYKTVALGTYFNKTGGADRFPNKATIQKAFWYALRNYPEYDLILEGITISTTASTYIELFMKAEKKFPKRKTIIYSFNTPLEVCLERVYKRNGGKPIDEDSVKSKYVTVQNSSKKFEDAGFTVIRVDNTKTSKEKATESFLTIMEKYREEV